MGYSLFCREEKRGTFKILLFKFDSRDNLRFTTTKIKMMMFKCTTTYLDLKTKRYGWIQQYIRNFTKRTETNRKKYNVAK